MAYVYVYLCQKGLKWMSFLKTTCQKGVKWMSFSKTTSILGSFGTRIRIRIRIRIRMPKGPKMDVDFEKDTPKGPKMHVVSASASSAYSLSKNAEKKRKYEKARTLQEHRRKSQKKEDINQY